MPARMMWQLTESLQKADIAAFLKAGIAHYEKKYLKKATTCGVSPEMLAVLQVKYGLTDCIDHTRLVEDRLVSPILVHIYTEESLVTDPE